MRPAARAAFTRINKADAWFQVLGLSWLTPILKAAAGDNPRAQVGEIWRLLGVPLLAIAVSCALGRRLRRPCKHRLGPCPDLSGMGTGGACQDAIREGAHVKKRAFYERQDARNAEHDRQW